MKTELEKENPKNDGQGPSNNGGNGQGNGNGNNGDNGKPDKEIRYTLDGEPQTTLEKELTANQILQAGGVDITQNYLLQLKGDGNISYKDNPTQIIKMHNNMEFLANYSGATTVS